MFTNVEPVVAHDEKANFFHFPLRYSLWLSLESGRLFFLKYFIKPAKNHNSLRSHVSSKTRKI